MMPPTPTSATAPQAAAAPTPGITVCIAAVGDGTFKVYPESEASAAPEGGAGEEQSEMAGAQTAPDVDTALDMARQMLGGAAGGSGGNDDSDALFEKGFNQARGTPLNRA